MVTVETCIRNIEAYLEIQLIMHDNDFKVEWNIDPSVQQELVPKLALQPIVENALEHGLDVKEEGEKLLKLYFFEENGDVVIRVEDNGIGMEQEQAEPLWHEPLKKLSLTVEQMNEIYSVVVTVPEECLPDNQACHGAIDLDRFHYLDQRVKEVLRRDSQKPIRNKFAYLLKMVRQDAGLPTE